MAGLLSKWLVRLGLVAVAAQAGGSAAAQDGARQAILKVGTPMVVEAPSGDGRYGVVFEDDGDTGYFYALDFSESDNPIQEAVHVYNVASVADRDRPSQVRVSWSPDQRKAGLWINDYPHAVFDFAGQRGYARSNFPTPSKWTGHDFAWDDAALAFFQ
jgi:hypothetical protein